MNTSLVRRDLRADIRAIAANPMFWALLAVLGLLLVGASPAHAADASASGGGGSLPWEGPIATLRKSISGPVAFGIALLGIIGCGAGLIWGGEVSEFLRRTIYLVLVLCLIVFANSLLTSQLFSGAIVPAGLTLDVHSALSAIEAGGGAR